MFWKHYVKEVLAGFTWEDFLFRNRLKRAAVKLIIESKNRVDIPYNDCTLIVMRGVQKCTCAGASLRGRNFTPLCCIKLDTATDPCCGFRVIIMTQANSQVNTRVLELLPKFKIKKMNRWCAV